MMSRSSSSSRIIKNNNLFHLLKSFKEFGGAIIVLIRDGALQLSSRPQQRISLYSCLFLGGSSECESMCIAGGAQTPLAHCRSGDADPAASTPHPSRRSTPGSPTWAPTNLPPLSCLHAAVHTRVPGLRRAVALPSENLVPPRPRAISPARRRGRVHGKVRKAVRRIDGDTERVRWSDRDRDRDRDKCALLAQ